MNIEHEDVQAMIANIQTVINRLPLKTKEDRLKVATFMLDMAYTTDESLAWKPESSVPDNDEIKSDEVKVADAASDDSQTLHEHTKSDSAE